MFTLPDTDTDAETDTDAIGFETHCVGVGTSVGKGKICVGVGQCEHTIKGIYVLCIILQRFWKKAKQIWLLIYQSVGWEKILGH